MRTTILFVIINFILISTTIGQTKKDSLIVFVGELIDIKVLQSPGPIFGAYDTAIAGKDTTISRKATYSSDTKFLVKYKILKLIFGKYKSNTIKFIALDHYGKPGFSNFKTSLLFISLETNGKFYHEKYQYFDVYRTKNDRWASSYSVDDYNHEYNKNTLIKPQRINFVKEVFYNIKGRNKEDISYLFPSPYFKIIGNKAIAVYGNYIEQLFELKKNGVLKARGIF